MIVKVTSYPPNYEKDNDIVEWVLRPWAMNLGGVPLFEPFEAESRLEIVANGKWMWVVCSGTGDAPSQLFVENV